MKLPSFPPIFAFYEHRRFPHQNNWRKSYLVFPSRYIAEESEDYPREAQEAWIEPSSSPHEMSGVRVVSARGLWRV